MNVEYGASVSAATDFRYVSAGLSWIGYGLAADSGRIAYAQPFEMSGKSGAIGIIVIYSLKVKKSIYIGI